MAQKPAPSPKYLAGVDPLSRSIQPRDRHRAATLGEIFGAWELHAPGSWQYIVISEGGSMGWVTGAEQPVGIMRRALIKMIDPQRSIDGGWHGARVSNGDLAEFLSTHSKPYEADYVFWIVEEVGQPYSSYPDARPREMVMAQYYKHQNTSTREPLRVERLRRIRD